LQLQFFSFITAVNAAPLIDDGNYTYISGMKWYNTYEAGQEVAKVENKPMLVYAWAIWCKFCEKLHKEVYPDPRIKPILENDFVLVAVDLDTNREDVNRFSFQYPPYLLFLNKDGEKITDIPGYVPVDVLLPILQQIRDIELGTIEVPHDLPRTEDRGET
jgi:thioredoxin-related protein